MKRPLVMHIGISKTGSSSIQHVLAEQRPALRAQGVYMPASPGWANHSLLPAACVSDLKILWGYHYATWEGMTPSARIARFADEFAAEMAGLPDDVRRVVITAEQIGGVLRRDEEVRRLADMLAPYFEPVRVVVYLRRQDQHAASAYSEHLRSGVLRDPSLPEGGPETFPDYDYGTLLDRWAGVFGAHAIQPRLFARETMEGGDVVVDFLKLLGAELPLLEDDPSRQSNVSLSEAGQQLLLAAGRRMEARAGTRPGQVEAHWRDTPAWRRLSDAVSDALPGRGWRPTRGEAVDFLARFAETNERARARFFPDRPSLFNTDMSDLPAAPAPGNAHELGQAALDVLLHETAAGARAEALSAMAQFRLNRRLKDRDAMRACLVRAIKYAPDMLAPRLRLAELFIEEGDTRQARQHAEAALKIAPKDDGALRISRKALLSGSRGHN